MALAGVGGGDLGHTLKTTCTVKSTLQTIVAVVGDIVELSTSGNWVVDEHSTGTEFRDAGLIRQLSDDKKQCTVEWYGKNKAFNVPYSGTATRGQAVISAASQTESFITSANTTESAIAVCVAVDAPATGFMDVLTR